MTKRNFALQILVFVFSIVATAQNGSIQGIVSDKSTGEKIPFANVSLLKNNQFGSIGTVTDSKGAFSLDKLEYADYAVVVSFIGFETDTIKGLKVSKEKPVVRLGNIALEVTGVALKELEINAMSNTQSTRLDRKSKADSAYGKSEF